MQTASLFPQRMFLAAAAIVLGLRLVVGWEHLRNLSEAGGNGLKLALGLMGLGYLACGVVAFMRKRDTAAGFFALHCVAQAIHWGGPPTVSAESLQLGIWLAYFTISMLGISAVLHFTLLFPSPWKVAGWFSTGFFLYFPVLLAGLLAIIRMSVDGPSGERFQAIFLTLEVAQVTLYGLLATVVIAIRYARAGRTERRATGLGVMLLGAVLGQLPYLVASLVAPAASQPWTLFFLLIPITITYAIVAKSSVIQAQQQET